MVDLYKKLSKERKELQESGEVPEWFTTAGWQLFKDKYQYQGQSYKGTCERIAKCAAKHVAKHGLDVQEWETKFYNLLWKGWLSPSTPVLSNMGTSKGMNVSCSGTYVSDSVYGFYDSFKENAILTKHGFGTSGYLSDIRPRGSKIATGGKASGITPVLKHFVFDMQTITQGCYIEGTQVLTDKGFVDFRDINTETNIAQLDEHRNVSFTKGEPTVRDWNGKMYNIKSNTGLELQVTPNHRMMINRLRKSGWSSLEEVMAEDVKYHRDVQHHVAGISTNSDNITPQERFMIAYQADGRKTNVRFNNDTFKVYFRFKKLRKVDRLKDILRDCNLDYSYKIVSDDVHEFSVTITKDLYKPDFSWVNISDFMGNRGIQFLREVAEWDSHKRSETSVQYVSTEKLNVDIIQAICSINNVRTRVFIYDNTHNKTKYRLSYVFDYKPIQGESITKESFDYDGKVYCCIVPNGRIIVRDLNGFVSVCGNTQRRGAFAGYIDIEHKDFYEIADLIQHEPDDLNIGWIVKDKFIKKLQNGDKEANNRFKKAMKSKLLTGKGYFFFVDKVNRNRPKMYKDKNLDVKASNLCVAPETLILTKFGYLPIVELEDKTIDVWNGEEWSTTTIRKTGTNQELVKVITDSGQELECTQYHKFYIKDRSAEYSNRIVEVSASELKRGDKLIKFELPVIDGELTLTNAYQNGFYSGDGCLVKNNSRIYLYGEKRNLLNYFPNRRLHTIQDDYDREYFYYDNLKPKFYIPTSDYSIDSRVQWLAGLFDADGCVINVNGSLTLQLVSTNKEFLKELQLMLQTLGVTSKIKFTREQGLYKLPANDGSDELKDFQCNAQYRILLSGNGLLQLKELGFNTNRLKIDGNIPNRNAERFIQIVDVEYNNRISDTYCFTEHKRHMGMFNGILTGQCAEIALHSSEEYSFSCVLSAMNLYWYDDWKDTTAVFDATVFLDCVAEEFITLAENIKGLEKTVDFTRKGRALGLGVCGFHTYLQEKRWPFEGLEAHTWNNQVFKHIRTEADKASKWMATVMGEPEWCAGYGVRNTHLMALMPTKATALIQGGISEGINPDPAIVFNQATAAGEMDRISPTFLKLLKERNMYSKETIRSITDNNGSVQHLEWLTDDEKLVFRTAFEMDQSAQIRLCSTRQKYVDQGQSINLFFSADEDEKYITKVHQQAFLDENLHSLYYIYTLAGVQAAKSECIACQ